MVVVRNVTHMFLLFITSYISLFFYHLDNRTAPLSHNLLTHHLRLLTSMLVWRSRKRLRGSVGGVDVVLEAAASGCRGRWIDTTLVRWLTYVLRPEASCKRNVHHLASYMLGCQDG